MITQFLVSITLKIRQCVKRPKTVHIDLVTQYYGRCQEIETVGDPPTKFKRFPKILYGFEMSESCEDDVINKLLYMRR